MSDLKSEKVFVMASGVNGPSGMRPETQLSDPMNWDTSVKNRTVWEDIRHARAIIRVKLSPDPGAIKARGTGFSELGPARILLCST